MPSPVRPLVRVRWAVRAVLALGVAASVTANILHADPNPISQTIAAWPPVALLLTVELISRVPVHRRALAAARFVATATIAGIAAWVSYWHMAGVTARYGETGVSAYLIPLTVDGLIVVASVCLVELAGRIAAQPAPSAVPESAVQVPAAKPEPAPGEFRQPQPSVPRAVRRPRAPSRNGSQPATVEDAVRLWAEWPDGLPRNRDNFAKQLRARGRTVKNERVGDLMRAASVPELVPA